MRGSHISHKPCNKFPRAFCSSFQQTVKISLNPNFFMPPFFYKEAIDVCVYNSGRNTGSNRFRCQLQLLHYIHQEACCLTNGVYLNAMIELAETDRKGMIPSTGSSPWMFTLAFELKTGTRTQCESPTWMTRTQLLDPSPLFAGSTST